MTITLNGTTGVTAAEFDGTVDASNLTGALPAIDGSALTDLNAAELVGALPAIDGSALTGIDTSPPTTYGAVGTYLFANRGSAGATIPTVGATYSGTGLYATGVQSFVYGSGGVSTYVAAGLNPAAVGAGTWRAMGQVSIAGGYNYYYPATLFLRIS